MSFQLPKLPYAYDALEPHIDALTMEIHHSKHHNGYTTNLNNAIAGTDLESKDILDILENMDMDNGAVRNNGGGFYNHDLFWKVMSPDGGGAPSGAIADAINDAYGSFDAFRDAFSKAAATRFGSGWAWLVKTDAGKLEIVQESNAGNPMTKGLEPIMTCDVWEHAYYIDKRNRRPAYIDDFWNLVDWETIGRRM